MTKPDLWTAVILMVLVTPSTGCIGESDVDRCRRIEREGLAHRASQLKIDRLSLEWGALLAEGKIDVRAYRDSTTATPPPKPSDATWASEHCWGGQLR